MLTAAGLGVGCTTGRCRARPVLVGTTGAPNTPGAIGVKVAVTPNCCLPAPKPTMNQMHRHVTTDVPCKDWSIRHTQVDTTLV